MVGATLSEGFTVLCGGDHRLYSLQVRHNYTSSVQTPAMHIHRYKIRPLGPLAKYIQLDAMAIAISSRARLHSSSATSFFSFAK